MKYRGRHRQSNIVRLVQSTPPVVVRDWIRRQERRPHPRWEDIRQRQITEALDGVMPILTVGWNEDTDEGDTVTRTCDSGSV